MWVTVNAANVYMLPIFVAKYIMNFLLQPFFNARFSDNKCSHTAVHPSPLSQLSHYPKCNLCTLTPSHYFPDYIQSPALPLSLASVAFQSLSQKSLPCNHPSIPQLITSCHTWRAKLQPWLNRSPAGSWLLSWLLNVAARKPATSPREITLVPTDFLALQSKVSCPSPETSHHL